MSIRIALVAGEASGDLLAARLIQALRRHYPQAVFEGVAGPLMQAAGCEALHDSERLAVMGLFEVLGRYRELKAMRDSLIKRWLRSPPDLFIGVDAPDFNLGLEERLRAAGIATCHYVSPTVWAWRKGRIKQIKRAVDLLLTLFPFETAVYQENHIDACFSGHPLADEIPLQVDTAAAREQLKLSPEGPLLAILPGSRVGEIKRLGAPFLRAALALTKDVKGLHCVCPVVKETHAAMIETLAKRWAPALPLNIVVGESRTAMAAADVVALASGTATLEACLLKKPMVVGYKISPLSYAILRHMIFIDKYSLPNLLSETARVPELIQNQLTVTALARQLRPLLTDPQARQQQLVEFDRIHHLLRRDASATAANAIAQRFRLDHAAN